VERRGGRGRLAAAGKRNLMVFPLAEETAEILPHLQEMVISMACVVLYIP
jgi:hypothetical protein